MPDTAKTKKQLIAELEATRARILELESGKTQRCEAPFDKNISTGITHQRSADYLRYLVRSIPDLVWLKDPDGLYLLCNQAFERLFGATEAEILGKTDADFVPKELAEFFRSNDRKAIAAGRPCVNEEWLTFARDGYQGLFETIKTPMYDHAGSLIGVLGIARDITDRKRAFEELSRVTNELNTIFDNVPATIWYKDDKNNFIRVNKSAAMLIGRKVEEIAGHSTGEIFPAEAAKYYADDLEVITSGQPKIGIIETATAKDGNIRYVSTDKLPIRDPHGNVTGVLAFAVDITELKRMQEVMIQTEKMMSLGGLAAGMAHEINNPLSAVMQSIQVVQNRLSKDSSVNLAAAEAAGCSFEAIKAFLEARGTYSLLEGAREAGSRAAKIVVSMLEFSRKSESNTVSVDINTLLDKSVELCANDYDLKKKYDFRKIAIERDFDVHLPPVPCTATQIEQVVMNLLRNAAQAMVISEKEGRAPRILLKTTREGDTACIVVQDNGPGMDTATQRKIFEPFFTTKGVGGGTGLGLSVSYFIIVNNHGGTLEVSSAPGAGARFVIRLPLAEQS